MAERDLFIAALDVDPAERDAYLSRACDGDAALRQRLEQLLQAYARADNFLAHPPLVAAGLTTATEGHAEDSALEAPGAVLGRYVLIEAIGEGGMGAVYRAEQTEPVRRQVALKIIKPGMDSRRILARFGVERQALALMDHPNIARVLDGGITPAGRPFFVMELVKGVPITCYCDDNQLALRQRLELFVSVCQAVQHAHQKGILHRDLKPSNVLVALIDGKGVPKLIDFGLAKSLAPDQGDGSVLTSLGQVVGTFEYMSPEQAGHNGVDVDTRSDVYSLGVLLYELLTGSTPLDRQTLRSTPVPEILRRIREQEPARPSGRLAEADQAPAGPWRADARKLSRLLRGELDWVVMKCLEKDRGRRYDTASALALDVGRYLHDEPVSARPPSRRYQLGKFVRRNRGGLASAVLLALALGLGSAGSVWQAARAGHAERTARAERDDADTARGHAERNYRLARQAVAEYLVLVTTNPDLKYRAEFHALRQRLLGSAVPFLEEFVRHDSDDPSIRGEQFGAYTKLGDLRTELGQWTEALRAFEQALRVAQGLVADYPGAAAPLQNLALGHYHIAGVLASLGRYPAAEHACLRGLDVFSRLSADFPAERLFQENLGDSYALLGIIRRELGRWSDAEAACRLALALHRKLVAADLGNPRHRNNLATTCRRLASLLGTLGRKEEAWEAGREAVDLFRKLVARYPGVLTYRTDLSATLINFGSILLLTGRRGEARKVYEEVVVLQNKLVDDFPRVPVYRQGLATTYNHLGQLHEGPHEGDAAEKLFRQALGLRRQLVADHPADHTYRSDLAVDLGQLGLLLGRRQRHAEAEAASREGLAIRRQLADAFPEVPGYAVALGGSCCNEGGRLIRQGLPRAALPWLARAVAVLEAVLARDPRRELARTFLRITHAKRVDALTQLGRHAEALKDLDRVIALDNGSSRLALRFRRAATLARLGRHTVALADADRLTSGPGVTAAMLYDAATVFALAAADRGETARAEQHATRAVALLGQARAAGLFMSSDWVRSLKGDRSLDALRSREDFRKLFEGR